MLLLNIYVNQAEEMALWLIALAVLQGAQSSISSTHVVTHIISNEISCLLV